MNFEHYLGLLTLLLGALAVKLRKLRRRLKQLNANLTVGNGTSLTVEITSNSNQEQKKED